MTNPDLQAGLGKLSRELGALLIDEPREKTKLYRKCKTCGAGKWLQCRTKSGNVATKPHKNR